METRDRREVGETFGKMIGVKEVREKEEDILEMSRRKQETRSGIDH